jgi:hypothetical protein
MSILSSSPTGIFRRKPVDEVEPEDLEEGGGLQRVLGLWQLTAIGIGGIIGAGIFSLAGAVASEKAGPGVLLSFLVAGIASACAALSYAEFAGMIPKAGSAYTYGYVVLGEGVGWFIGWDLLLEYTAIVAVVGIGISGYFGFLVEQIGLNLPEWMLGAPGSDPDQPGRVVDLFALLLCLLIAFILTRGVRSAARVETALVWLKVGVVVLIIALGVFYVKHRQLHALPAVRLGRRIRRRVGGVLRRLRLRRDEHCGRGVHRSSAGAAECNHAFAGDLDGALRPGLPGADRDGQVHRGGPGVGLRTGLRRRRTAVDRDPDLGRCHSRDRDGDVDVHVRRDAGVVLDVPRPG